ncbi:hypothetical protein [Methylobacterium tarhaniae]|uniref:hypothetical protein n=1 Tax=Methylobacterium tarhaniae TaxID=1187852 RepID=UPI000AB6DEC3|nr:hypothetical protein [Methylobacterium tarhaniae]
MPNGLANFKNLLREFRELAAWAAGPTAAPFVAHLLDLAPPWPRSIVFLTTITELIALVLAFQLLSGASKKTIQRVMLSSLVVIMIFSPIYLIAASQFTIRMPNKDLTVAGLVCTGEARAVYKDKCPWLGRFELADAEYNADQLWEFWSISLVRTGLVMLWSLIFGALSMLFGSFLIHQMRLKPPRTRRDFRQSA